MQGADGDFYGTTDSGGSGGEGTVFKITAAGTLTTLVHFTGINGCYSRGGLVQSSDGNFYGTTFGGGSGWYGTVFKMTLAGTLSTLANFYPTTGRNPSAGLVQGSDGNFYGTTSAGGINRFSDNGMVFKMTSAGALTTLANFNGTNGSDPSAAMIQGSDGDFYGTATKGSSGSFGKVFKVTSAGVMTTLVNFIGTNGSYPRAGLVQGSDGNFYGTASEGGSTGYGTVFKMTAAGTLTSLVNFAGSNGRYPRAGLVVGNDGYFYGTTSEGGSSGYGTVFKMSAAGTLTTLVNFTGTNGRYPSAGLMQSSDGNFYSTTLLGGSSAQGIVYRMTPAGVLTTIVNFNGVNGTSAQSGLLRGSDGHLYGITGEGGTTSDGKFAGGGQIFRIRMGPGVATLAADSLQATGANLNASVNPGDYQTTVSFRYGVDPALGTYTETSPQTLAAGSIPDAVSLYVSGLTASTVYYYRVVASNAENTVPQAGGIVSFTTGVMTAADTWRMEYFGDAANTGDAADNADPDKDGLVNLLERAFNLDPTQCGVPVLTPGTGTSGLPAIGLSGTGATSMLRVEFLRRKNSGLIYIPKRSSTLAIDSFVPMSATLVVASINEIWERVIIQEPADPDVTPRMFATVEVSLP